MKNQESQTDRVAGDNRPSTATAASPAAAAICVWLAITSGAFIGPLIAESPPSSPLGANTNADRETDRRTAFAQGERSPAITSLDLAARERFLAVERFARLGDEQQARGFPDFYRTLAPYFMNSIIEAILSSYPDDILDPRTFGHPGGDAKMRWARQLADASAKLTPEEVADQLAVRLWLDVAGRARTVQLLERHASALAALLTEDLASQDLSAVKRACIAIGDLRLRPFTDQVLALYLADTPLSPPAHTALVWLNDPAIVRPLLEQIEQDPRRIIRHAGLFQGPLAGRPAEPILVRLLDFPDVDVRYHAACALYECNDSSLANWIPGLAKEADPRLRSAALTLAQRLSDAAFARIRNDLAPLLSTDDERMSLEAVTCFAKRKDLLAGPPLLQLLNRERMDAGQAVTVIQAVNALAGSAFNYDLHNWGPRVNGKAIGRFEAWLRDAALK